MGAAGLAFIPALQKHPNLRWVALADTAADTRASYSQEYGVAAYASMAELLAHPGLDALIIATPTELHNAQTQQAAAAGKHVLVEKPMAVSLDEGRAMLAAAMNAGVVLQVGHSHSYDQPIQAMRALIASGELGAVGMVHTWCYTDWMLRPRRPAELDVSLGGGVTFRQGAHQFDILRLLCGGVATQVRAQTLAWNRQRPGIGAHSVFIDFDNGAVATAVYNGYGGLANSDLGLAVSEWGLPLAAAQSAQGAATLAAKPWGAPNAMAYDSPDAELLAKRQRARNAIPTQAPHQPFFGLTLVSCERGDIRQSPQGLRVYSAEGQREIVLPTDQSPRDLVLNEFAQAITSRSAPLHDGAWGLATLEVCVAALQSARSRQAVPLHAQVAVR